MNLPTQLTLGRICLVPLVVVFLISTDAVDSLVAAVLFAPARRALDWLAGLSGRAPFCTGIVLILLGAWSIGFGVLVDVSKPA